MSAPAGLPQHGPIQLPSRRVAPEMGEAAGQRHRRGYLCDTRLGGRRALEQSTLLVVGPRTC